ncbi:MAG: hypothetical protein ACTHLA_03940 [Asticcacaulis sp.]|uniref:hypothetical protein n=1 Tax=Asticcacaulis sp. TaxID=1872648 RepID=UPI003F7CAA61
MMGVVALVMTLQSVNVAQGNQTPTVQQLAESTQDFYPIGYGVLDNSQVDYFLMSSLSIPKQGTTRAAVLVNVRADDKTTFQEIELFSVNCTGRNATETYRLAYRNGEQLDLAGQPSKDDVSLLLPYVQSGMISQICSGAFPSVQISGKDLSYFR